jgi:hypothetical protein
VEAIAARRAKLEDSIAITITVRTTNPHRARIRSCTVSRDLGTGTLVTPNA